jgi:type VI secretion system ImpM family protein
MPSQPTSIHCFGKLPIAGDFIRHKLDTDEARAFAGWIEKGQSLVEAVLRSSSGVKSASAAPPPRRYRFACDPVGRRLVVGIIHESHDRGGLRRFPFTCFTTVEASAFKLRPSLMPICFRQGWESLEERMLAFGEAKDAAGLAKSLDGFVFPFAEPDRAATDGIDRMLQAGRSGDLWKQLFGDAGRQRRLALFDVLVRALQPYQKSRPEEIPAALKLPIAGSADQAHGQAAFWVDLLGGLLKGGRPSPNVFLGAPAPADPARNLHMFCQRPDERQFASLMTQKYESENVEDLTKEIPQGKGGTVLSADQRRLLESDETRLIDLVRARWL